MGGAEILGLLQAVVQQINPDYAAGAHPGGDHCETQADASLANHRNRLAQQVWHLLAGEKYRSGWLAHDPFFQGPFIGQQGHAFRPGDDVFIQPAEPRPGNNDDSLPFLELIGFAVDNHAGNFVARLARRKRIMLLGKHRPVVVADVAAADRNPLYFDQALAVGRRRSVHINKFKVLGAGQSGRFHVRYLLPSVVVGAVVPLGRSLGYLNMRPSLGQVGAGPCPNPVILAAAGFQSLFRPPPPPSSSPRRDSRAPFVPHHPRHPRRGGIPEPLSSPTTPVILAAAGIQSPF